jgi:uncharacterized protein (TIRG00374 family)
MALLQVLSDVVGRNRWLMLSARVGVTLAMFAGIVWFVDFAAFWNALEHADWWQVILACSVAFLLPIFAAARWRHACMICDCAMNYRWHVKAQLLSSFVGQALPSYLGAEGVRTLLLAKTGCSLVTSGVTAILDRLSGLAVLVAIFLWGGALHQIVELTVEGREVMTLLTWVFGGAATLGVSIFVALRIAGKDLKVFRDRILRSGEGAQLKGKIHLFSIVILLSICLNVLTFSILLLLFSAIGAEISFLQLFVIFPAAFLAMMFPISISGWGVREGVFAFFFSFSGVPIEKSVAVSLIYGVIMVFASVPGAGLLLRRGFSSVSRNLN